MSIFYLVLIVFNSSRGGKTFDMSYLLSFHIVGGGAIKNLKNKEKSKLVPGLYRLYVRVTYLISFVLFLNALIRKNETVFEYYYIRKN